jgi:hypothetical protein
LRNRRRERKAGYAAANDHDLAGGLVLHRLGVEIISYPVNV